MENIKIFSNVFSEDHCKKILEYIKMPRWEFGHCSKPDAKSLFWIMHLDDDFFTNELFSVVKKLSNIDCSLERSYANGQTFGLDGEFHIDSSSSKDYSFLYYAPIEWDKSWGGETVVCDPSGMMHYFQPIPNCAIMFPATWWHRGLAPTKEYNGLRVTISFKLQGI